jgi:hypothetical protein
MKTALAFWRGSTAPAASRSTFQHPGAINWRRISLLFTLWIILAGNLAVPFVATAQNLGTSPQFGKAVQGQQATTVEGTVLNIVNWGCNVIAPVIAIACLGVAGWHFKSGRGYLGWGVTGVALLVISPKLRAFNNKDNTRCLCHNSFPTFFNCCSIWQCQRHFARWLRQG